eukprot:17628-Heterococcus_DN1.PRE.2
MCPAPNSTVRYYEQSVIQWPTWHNNTHEKRRDSAGQVCKYSPAACQRNCSRSKSAGRTPRFNNSSRGKPSLAMAASNKLSKK